MTQPDSLLRKEIYTRTDVAILCNAEARSVQAWIDGGEIPYLLLPGGHIRIRHQDLYDFMERRHMTPPENWHGSPPQKFRVLVVDDDSDLLEIFSELLKDEPRLEIKTESSGFTAGLLIAGWHPDLILLDFLMPEISGFEICAKIRENPMTRDIPVLAVTSLGTDKSKVAVCASGVSDFLGKPFHSEKLLEKVRILLGIHPKAVLSWGAQKADDGHPKDRQP